MSNLENFNNIYASLSESAYTGHRPNNFPYEQLSKDDKKILDTGKSIEFDFSQTKTVTYKKNNEKISETTRGGTNLPKGLDANGNEKEGRVYLQPDRTLHTVDVKTNIQVPNPNGGYHTETYITGNYQKGLLTDEKAGFNSYFVTDTPTLNKDTKQTYLAIRGSDAATLDNMNDWIANDANFALTNSYIPQAKLANQAMVEKIKEIKQNAPQAKLNVTGHSLGTMVSAQAVAQLYHDDPNAFKTIGEVVLFDGPDVTKSLKKMGLSDKEIKAVGDKVTYYVNPFDMVSMLNRTKPYKEQFGNVNVIVPLRFSTTFDDKSSHDFGEFQMDAYGKPLVASKDFHPEMLDAGHQLAKLIDTTLEKAKNMGINGISAGAILTALTGGIGALVALGMTAAQAKTIYDEFNKSYSDIISEAKKKAKAWNKEHIPDYQNRIRGASGSQKIELRAELLQTVAQDAMICSEEFTTQVKTELADTLEAIQKEIVEGYQAANNVAQHLSPIEVNALLADFKITNLWDTGIEDSTNQAAQNYQTEIEQFSASLMKITQNIEQVDAQGADGFNTLMTETQVNWGQAK